MPDLPRQRARKAHLSIETIEPTSLGSGFISGLLSALLGIAGFGAVLCLRFPQYLTHAELRQLYSLGYLRGLIHVTLVASFLLGSVSAFRRANKALALTGIGFTLAAALLGGSQAPVQGQVGERSSSSVCCSTQRSSFRSSGCSRVEPINPCSGANGSSTSPTSSSTRC
jgi:hypothetical protein